MVEDEAVRAIVAGLSADMSGRLRSGKWNIYPHVMRFIRLGLVEKLPGYYSQMTPLGVAVKAHLLNTKDQGNGE